MVKSTSPTPTNPLILRYKGHIPSLKNNREPGISKKTGKLIFMKNDVVKAFLSDIKTYVKEQWQLQAVEQGFTPLLVPDRLIAWVQIVFYSASNKTLPNSDGDNAYTTLQETWQEELKIIVDDKQVGAAWWQVDFTRSRALEHATVYLFQRDEGQEPFEQAIEFYMWRKLQLKMDVVEEKIPDLLKGLLDETET